MADAAIRPAAVGPFGVGRGAEAGDERRPLGCRVGRHGPAEALVEPPVLGRLADDHRAPRAERAEHEHAHPAGRRRRQVDEHVAAGEQRGKTALGRDPAGPGYRPGEPRLPHKGGDCLPGVGVVPRADHESDPGELPVDLAEGPGGERQAVAIGVAADHPEHGRRALAGRGRVEEFDRPGGDDDVRPR